MKIKTSVLAAMAALGAMLGGVAAHGAALPYGYVQSKPVALTAGEVKPGERLITLSFNHGTTGVLSGDVVIQGNPGKKTVMSANTPVFQLPMATLHRNGATTAWCGPEAVKKKLAVDHGWCLIEGEGGLTQIAPVLYASPFYPLSLGDFTPLISTPPTVAPGPAYPGTIMEMVWVFNAWTKDGADISTYVSDGLGGRSNVEHMTTPKGADGAAQIDIGTGFMRLAPSATGKGALVSIVRNAPPALGAAPPAAAPAPAAAPPAAVPPAPATPPAAAPPAPATP